ncbi:winged helix-turn-helix domain-containing protein [Pseudoalteromonas sp. PS5]|uniref:winged helix-turn-helix domain-containing protein n=1 Tax=Pseudoalteromonas sp. PS5 TaxID=1437473 RepID=UPI000FFF3656|nr:winged helix-turn-helix domain-containing protein [Pseudoalteromonas sp. PS5]RXE96592.1 translocation protein TolB [Pseudoalteromonas sp. PS5]
MQHDTTFQLLGVNIDPIGHSMSKDGKVCCVQPKFIEVLSVLARAYPNVVTREEIIAQVWDGNLFVGEKALTNAIWHLRKTFKTLDCGAENTENEVIETIRKSGYRLKVPPHFELAAISPEVQPNIAQFISVNKVMLLTTMCILVVTLMLYLNSDRPNDTLVDVTDYPGRELFPSISPNGQFMAFAWRKLGGHAHLYLKDLTHPNRPPVKLSNGNENASVSVWARDNQTVFFIAKQTGKCAIKSLNTVTKAQKVLADCPVNTTTTLTYSAEKNLLGFVAKKSEGSGGEVVLLDLTHLTETVLDCQLNCQDSYPESIVMSPDASKIVISRNLPNGLENLYLKMLDSGREITLLQGHDDLRGVTWHPTDNYLVVSSIEHGARKAYKVSLDGKILASLPFSGLSYPNFSASGALYFHNWEIDTSIMKLDLSAAVASSPFPILHSQVSFRYPDYSSGSEQLLFISNQSGFDEVWMSNLKGDERVQLTQLELQALHPAWSKDGSKVVFITKSSQGSQLQLLDVADKQVIQIKTGLEYHGKPSWSSDDKHIYVSDGKDIFRVSIEVHQKPVTKLTAGTTAIEYKDALYIYKSEQQEMWKMDLMSKEHQHLFTGAYLASSASWSVSRSGIYYLSVHRGDFRISYFDFASKQHKDIIRVPERSFSRSRGLEFIETKNWLLFTGYEIPQVDIKRIDRL